MIPSKKVICSCSTITERCVVVVVVVVIAVKSYEVEVHRKFSRHIGDESSMDAYQ